MKKMNWFLALAALLGICASVRGQDATTQPRGVLGSAANLGQAMRERTIPTPAGGGAQGGKSENHAARNEAPRNDTTKHAAGVPKDHHASAPAPKNSGKTKGK